MRAIRIPSAYISNLPPHISCQWRPLKWRAYWTSNARVPVPGGCGHRTLTWNEMFSLLRDHFSAKINWPTLNTWNIQCLGLTLFIPDILYRTSIRTLETFFTIYIINIPSLAFLDSSTVTITWWPLPSTCTHIYPSPILPLTKWCPSCSELFGRTGRDCVRKAVTIHILKYFTRALTLPAWIS